MRIWHRLGAAVFASQAAGLRHFPIDQHRISGKIVSRLAHSSSGLRANHGVPLSTEVFAERVFSVALVTNNQPAEIWWPRKQPFNPPTSAIPSQATQVLGRICSIHAVWGDQFNSVSAKLAIQFVGVIGIVAY
jgi:hypothetical protein